MPCPQVVLIGRRGEVFAGVEEAGRGVDGVEAQGVAVGVEVVVGGDGGCGVVVG